MTNKDWQTDPKVQAARARLTDLCDASVFGESPAYQNALDALCAAVAAAGAEDTRKVTRFEVIDHRKQIGAGRVFSAWDCAIEQSYQDAGYTLKVFVTDAAMQQDTARQGEGTK